MNIFTALAEFKEENPSVVEAMELFAITQEIYIKTLEVLL
jgi:hypothetical protein